MIYFIQIEGTEYVKVGRASNPQKRLMNLSCAHPFPLELVHTFRTENDVVVEKQIHAYLKPYRMRGEWFDISPDKRTETINRFETGTQYADNPVIDGYLYLRSTIVRMPEGHLQTQTEPCFFCHRKHIHGAIDTVRVVGEIQSYGHRVAHCPTVVDIKRRHPNGQMLSSGSGYYLWIEDHEAARLNRIAMRPYASYVSKSEYYYPPG